MLYLLVAVGSVLDLGSVGGGDSPLGVVALALAIPGFVLATVSFVLGASAAVRRGESS